MSPLELQNKRTRILDEVHKGDGFADICKKFGVTWSVVYALAFHSSEINLCDKCGARGIIGDETGKTTACERCKGEGYISS